MSEQRTIACVVGARPNFPKMASVLAGLQEIAPKLRPVLVHTGQHYDQAMSGSFFEQLGLPTPDVHLDVGSASHGAQTARVLERFEAWLLDVTPRPAATVVVGDVNSTVACALASVKLGIPAIHVEAGLRSFDRTMPEEINRVLTDSICELLLVSEPSGVTNLRNEGRPEHTIALIGNVMIDALERQLPAAREREQAKRMGFEPGRYALWTVHRPANVDDAQSLAALVDLATAVAGKLPVVLPTHPRTRQRLEANGLWSRLSEAPGVHVSEPFGYQEFLSLQATAGVVITDSGGIQEETTVLGTPCLTLRANTERPITLEEGTNTLIGPVGGDGVLEALLAHVNDVVAGRYKAGRRPKLWDGKAGERIAHTIERFLADR